MKIVQILAGQIGEDGHIIYGLDDEGMLYELRDRREPYIQQTGGHGQPNKVIYRDGNTGGWKPLYHSGERAKTVPHPSDPSRAERS